MRAGVMGWLLLVWVSACQAEKIAALIVDGQNNHPQWPKTTMMMKTYLEQTGRFDVDIARTQFVCNGGEWLKKFPLDDGKRYHDGPAKTDPEFRPKFADYDVVISNFGYGAAAWPESTKVSFVDFVHSGGGFVVVHAADNAFGDWPEYNRMIGLGGWGGRDAGTGPYVYLNDDGRVIRDTARGIAGEHGQQHEFQIVVRDPHHPITNGVPRVWLHCKDELYQRLRGPAEQMTILATAYAAKPFGGTGRHEPMMMTVKFGRGRIYHTPLGHADYSMECVGFATTFVRGCEWAATGEVTIHEIPKDFPKPNRASRRAFRPEQ